MTFIDFKYFGLFEKKYFFLAKNLHISNFCSNFAAVFFNVLREITFFVVHAGEVSYVVRGDTGHDK